MSEGGPFGNACSHQNSNTVIIIVNVIFVVVHPILKTFDFKYFFQFIYASLLVYSWSKYFVQTLSRYLVFPFSDMIQDLYIE